VLEGVTARKVCFRKTSGHALKCGVVPSVTDGVEKGLEGRREP